MTTNSRDLVPTSEIPTQPNLPAVHSGEYGSSSHVPTGKLTKAISAVMEEIDAVAKHGVNQFHRYQYARMEDILKKVTPLLGKYGIVIFQDECERSMLYGDTTITIRYEFEIAHESGEVWPKRLSQSGMSRCKDSKGNWDDKAINKCHTAARKYFLLSLFQIPTGEESDADHSEHDQPASMRATPAPTPLRPKPVAMPDYDKETGEIIESTSNGDDKDKKAQEKAAQMIKRINDCKSEDELSTLKENETVKKIIAAIYAVNKNYGNSIMGNIDRMYKDLAPKELKIEIPTDPEEALQEIDFLLSAGKDKAEVERIAANMKPRIAVLDFPPDVLEAEKLIDKHLKRVEANV